MSSDKGARSGGGPPRSGVDDGETDGDFGFEEKPAARLNLGNKPELRRILSRLQEGSKPHEARKLEARPEPRKEPPPAAPVPVAEPSPLEEMELEAEPEEEPEPEPPPFYELRARDRPKLIVAGGVDEARAYVPPTKVQS